MTLLVKTDTDTTLRDTILTYLEFHTNYSVKTENYDSHLMGLYSAYNYHDTGVIRWKFHCFASYNKD